MASNTPNLNLYKKDPVTDGEDVFNIETMLNENWDKIDKSAAILGKDGFLPSSILPDDIQKNKLTLSNGQLQRVTVDLNDLNTATRFVYANSGCKNKPDEFSEGIIEVFRFVDSTNRTFQRATDAVTFKTYTRGGVNNNWTPWLEVTTASSYTAKDVLTKLLTVDGSGSGLDADMVDGWHLNQDVRTTASPTFANVTATKQLKSIVATGTAPFGVNSQTVVTNLNADMVDGYHAGSGSTGNTIAVRNPDGILVAMRMFLDAPNGTSPIRTASKTLVENLNADMVDGFHASQSSKPNTLATRDNLGGLELTSALVIKNSGGISYEENRYLGNISKDYTRAVILLHPSYDGVILEENYCVGTFFFRRGASVASNNFSVVDVLSKSAYNSNQQSLRQRYSNTQPAEFALVTYNGVKYKALKVPYSAANYAGISFTGYTYTSGNLERLKLIEYYRENTSEVLNKEINDSITTIPDTITENFNLVAFKASQGTAPFTVASNTEVVNLNAQMLNGYMSDAAATANRIARRDAAGNLTSRQFISTMATGSAPLTVSSTTMVKNLNSEMVGGKTLGQIAQGSLSFAVTTGTAAALVATLNPAVTALTAGTRVTIKAHVAASGAVTLNLNGLGAKSIKKPNGNNPNLVKNGVYTLVYDGSAFILQGEGGEYGQVTADKVLSGVTFGTENGLSTGTMPAREAYTEPINSLWNGNHLFVRIPKGAYMDAGGLGYPEIRIPPEQARADGNIKPENIRAGVWIYGVLGKLKAQQYASGSYVQATNKTGEPYKPGYSAPSLTVTGLNFFPKLILIYSRAGTHNVATIYYYSQMGYDGASYTSNAAMFSTDTNRSFSSAFMAATPQISNGGYSPYVNSTGFKLPVYEGSAIYGWEAVGWDV